MQRRLVLAVIGVLLCSAAAGAVPVPVHTAPDWNNGSFTDTTVVGGDLQLQAGASVGSYQSAVYDLGDAYDWGGAATSSTLNGGDATLTVETSTDNFATVQNQTTIGLSGGDEQFSLDGFFPARYVRFSYDLTAGADSPVVHGTNISVADPFYFMLRSGPCRGGEQELFSLSNRSNAHAASPGFYPQLRVCGGGLDAVAYRQVCSGFDGDVLSFFGANTTVTHLSTDDSLFDFKLCTDALSVGVRDRCTASTKAVISIYETPESHVAAPGVYGQHLCAGRIQDVQAAVRFHLGPDDQVYLNRTQNPAQGVYDDTAWDAPFIAAENASMVAGLVAGEGADTTAVGYGERGGDHVFNMTQRRGADVSYYVPFTRGDHLDLADRRVLIAQQDFLDQVNPNFGLTFAQQMIVTLTYQFQSVDIVNDATVPRGVYDIILQHMGSSGGVPEVAVNVSTR